MNTRMIGNSTKFQRKNVKLADSSVGNRKISMGSRAEGTKGAMTASPLLTIMQLHDHTVKVAHAPAPTALYIKICQHTNAVQPKHNNAKYHS
mmetsp:Transcript_44467/g.107136  ORF Transcript_44467/g.107136 Transcript_44467/m.107136 type:complete len:92 (+) Transcript_44467:470-745(+)